MTVHPTVRGPLPRSSSKPPAMTSLSFPLDLVELENVLRDGPPSITINMTSCSELEKETYEKHVSNENCSGEIDKTMAALKAMPICLNWGADL